MEGRSRQEEIKDNKTKAETKIKSVAEIMATQGDISCSDPFQLKHIIEKSDPSLCAGNTEKNKIQKDPEIEYRGKPTLKRGRKKLNEISLLDGGAFPTDSEIRSGIKQVKLQSIILEAKQNMEQGQELGILNAIDAELAEMMFQKWEIRDKESTLRNTGMGLNIGGS